jgi:hypothetical protein
MEDRKKAVGILQSSPLQVLCWDENVMIASFIPPDDTMCQAPAHQMATPGLEAAENQDKKETRPVKKATWH